MDSIDKALSLYTNRELFEEIHKAKNSSLALLGNISNRIDPHELTKIHPTHKGTKISKGNELERCPYQVLDLVRDFDPDIGLNIRVLHWWGYGLYIFALMGSDVFNQEEKKAFLRNSHLSGFIVSDIASPFSYKQIIENYEWKKNQLADVISETSLEGRIQIVKKLQYGVCCDESEDIIYEEIIRLFLQLKKFAKH